MEYPVWATTATHAGVRNARCLSSLVWVIVASAACSSNEPAAPLVVVQAGSGGGAGVSSGPGGAGAGTAAAAAASAGAPSGGSGGATVGAAGSTSTGGAAGVGGVAGAGGVGGAENPLNQLAQAFESFRMELPCDHDQEQPCEAQNSAVPNRGYLCCYIDQTIERKRLPPVDKDLSFGGELGKVYDVTLRVRGVVENKDYGAGGTKQGDWVRVGGARPAPSAIHVFGIATHDPELNYFLNSWNDTSDLARIIAVDYQVTIPIKGGAKVRVFEYDDIGKIWKNAEGLKVEGIAPYPEAFEGQFLQLNVVSVNLKP